jgi:hypothetical protein
VRVAERLYRRRELLLRPGDAAERWYGTNWSIQPAPNPVAATSVFLLAVSCASKTACTAVGTYQAKATDPLTFAVRWNGRS